MRKRCQAKRGKKKQVAELEESRPASPSKKKQHAILGAIYQSGMILNTPSVVELPSMLNKTGSGSPSQDFAKGTSLRLEGRTDAQFDGGTFETQNVRVSRAQACESCAQGDPCIRARGTLVARYHVTTTVTLPNVNDFPDLTPCQRQRVEHAIASVLAPHEQDHVRAFGQYNGVTRIPFDLTLCRSAFDAVIQDMFNEQESARRDSAQAASDALDPFDFEVDIDCEDPPEQNTSSTAINEALEMDDDEQGVAGAVDTEAPARMVSE